MLKIHRPIVCLIGAVILVVSAFFYQYYSLEWNHAMTRIDGLMPDWKHSLNVQRQLDALGEAVVNTRLFIGMSLGGIVLGVLTILYGLIPDKPKE